MGKWGFVHSEASSYSTTTKEAVKEVDDSDHTDSHVEHVHGNYWGKRISESGVGVATPTPVSYDQCDADGRWYLSAQEPSLLCL